MTLLVEMSFLAFNPEPGLQHHSFHPPEKYQCELSRCYRGCCTTCYSTEGFPGEAGLRRAVHPSVSLTIKKLKVFLDNVNKICPYVRDTKYAQFRQVVCRQVKVEEKVLFGSLLKGKVQPYFS